MGENCTILKSKSSNILHSLTFQLSQFTLVLRLPIFLCFIAYFSLLFYWKSNFFAA